MKENQFGLSVKTAEYGYVEFQPLSNLHKQKARAGKLFQSNPNILSVCVFDINGNGNLLSLKKDPVTKECVMRIEEPASV